MFNRNEYNSALARIGMTNKELAERIGMSKNTLCSRTTGKSFFDTEEIDKICAALKITDNNEKAKIFLSKTSQNRDDKKLDEEVSAYRCIQNQSADIHTCIKSS